MPELPEVEITARLLDAELRGTVVESAMSPGINALKTFDPPLHAGSGAAASTSSSTSATSSASCCT